MDKLYFDGNEKRIAWIIENNETKFEKTREHSEIYFDKVTSVKSKYIALHVWIFWAIGRFIIKDGENVKIMVDLKSMYVHLTGKNQEDRFIRSRINFIKQIIEKRSLQVEFEIIEPSQNIATNLLSSQ